MIPSNATFKAAIDRFSNQPPNIDKKNKVFLKLNKNGTLEAKTMSDKGVRWLEKMRMNRHSKEYDLHQIIKTCTSESILPNLNCDQIKILRDKAEKYNANAKKHWILFRKQIDIPALEKIIKRLEEEQPKVKEPEDKPKPVVKEASSEPAAVVKEDEVKPAKKEEDKPEPVVKEASRETAPIAKEGEVEPAKAVSEPAHKTTELKPEPKEGSTVKPLAKMAASTETVAFNWEEYKKKSDYDLLMHSSNLTPNELKNRQGYLIAFITDPTTSSSDVEKLLKDIKTQGNLDPKLLERDTILKLINENKGNRDNSNKIFVVLRTVPKEHSLQPRDLFSLVKKEKGIAEEIIIDCIDQFPTEELLNLKLINEGTLLEVATKQGMTKVSAHLTDKLSPKLKDTAPKLNEIKDKVSELVTLIAHESSGPILTSLVNKCLDTLELIKDKKLQLTEAERGTLTKMIEECQTLAVEKIEVYYINDKIEVLTSRAFAIEQKKPDDRKKDLEMIIKQKDELAAEVGRFISATTTKEVSIKSVTESLEFLNDVLSSCEKAVAAGTPLVASISSKDKILLQKGDGNCLFRSFATALDLQAEINLDTKPEARAKQITGHGDNLEDKYHGFLRQQAADFIEAKYREKDEGWLLALQEACREHVEKIHDPVKRNAYMEASADKRLEMYMKDARTDKVFATNIQLQALAQIYTVNIDTYKINEKTGKMERAVVADLEIPGTKTLRLHYTGNHYNVFMGE